MPPSASPLCNSHLFAHPSKVKAGEQWKDNGYTVTKTDSMFE